MKGKLHLLAATLIVSSIGFATAANNADINSVTVPVVAGTGSLTDSEVGSVIYDLSAPGFKGFNSAGGWDALGGSANVPAGAILPFGGTTAPAGFLMCDGTSYLRTTYTNLATVFSCSGSTCAYGAADATHFNVPDLRGRFLRGVDGGTGRDPDAAGRSAMATGGNANANIGSVQPDAYASHTHGINTYPSGGAVNVPSQSAGGSGGSTATLASGGSETRPINAYVNYIIKY